jgi:hypothetical protein
MSRLVGFGVLVLTLVAWSSLARAQAVPQTMTFTARFEDNGAPMQGQHLFEFTLWEPDGAGGIFLVWTENPKLIDVVDGLVDIELGVNPFGSVFHGSSLFLVVKVDGTTLTPGIELTSVPYAFTAGQLGPYEPSDLQERVEGTCGWGTAMSAIDNQGQVDCQPLPAVKRAFTSSFMNIGTTETQLQTITVSFPGPGYATISVQNRWSPEPTGTAYCFVYRSGEAIPLQSFQVPMLNSFRYASVTAFDQVQLAGPVTYTYACEVVGAEGGVTQLSERQMIVQFFPSSL